MKPEAYKPYVEDFKIGTDAEIAQNRPVETCLVRGVAQSGSAPALGAGCRGFKSLRPDHLYQKQERPRVILGLSCFNRRPDFGYLCSSCCFSISRFNFFILLSIPVRKSLRVCKRSFCPSCFWASMRSGLPCSSSFFLKCSRAELMSE